jgi:HEAT repeats/Putative zinc-finger
MNHNQYREWLQLLMYDELTTGEHTALDQHLKECAECRQELEELKEFHSTLLEVGAIVPDENTVQEARRQLQSALRTEKKRPAIFSNMLDIVTTAIIPNYKIALGGIVVLVAGMFVGRTWRPSQQEEIMSRSQMQSVSASLEGEPRITNVRFINSAPNSKDIEFTFDAVSPVHMKGSINDEQVQKVLAHALVNDQNPGVRLRSVSAFASRVQSLSLPDKDVKAALILALKTDDNPGVRKEALKALQSFPFDEAVKQAFLHVLMHDTNPALRIAAINSLDSTRVQGQATDKDLLEVLRERMHADENNYVRIRAKSVLEEVKQQ